MKIDFKPDNRVCARNFEIEVEENVIKDIKIVGGCAGNTLGISSLVKGMKVDDAIKKLKGIPCGERGTSCPDQLASALEQIK